MKQTLAQSARGKGSHHVTNTSHRSRTCDGPGCQAPPGRREQTGLCTKHYADHGETPQRCCRGILIFLMPSPKATFPQSFESKLPWPVSEANDCQYCLSAHSAIGRSVGLSEEAIEDSRKAESTDPKEATVLAVTRKIVENRGWVSDEDVAKLRKVGFFSRRSCGIDCQYFADVVYQLLQPCGRRRKSISLPSRNWKLECNANQSIFYSSLFNHYFIKGETS